MEIFKYVYLRLDVFYDSLEFYKTIIPWLPLYDNMAEPHGKW